MIRTATGALAALVSLASLGSCVDATASGPEPAPPPTATAREHPPSAAAEQFASDVADAMIDRIVALLFREFAVTTAENAAVGTAAISNVFHDGNPTMRLVGDVEPLQANNVPQDDFEATALAAAKLGNNYFRTERVNGDWWVRKSIAVSTGFSTSCVHCHANFATVTNPWVGALMVRARVDD
jgi:hypothetical protein